MNKSVDGIFEALRQRQLNEEVESEESQFSVNEEDEPEVQIDEEDLDEATKKVVRDGKVVTKKVTTRKKRLTSAQKKALALARKKAHTGSANRARAKSLKVRSKRGLNDEEEIVCEECGFTGTAADFENEEGRLICPECGADCGAADEACHEESVDVAELAVRLDECEASDYMRNALNEGKYDLVQRYLKIKEG